MVATVRRSLATTLEMGADTYVEWRRDRPIGLGARLSYYSLLAAVPLVLVAFATAQLILGSERIEAELAGATDGVLGSAGEDFAALASDGVQLSFTQGQLGLIALAVLLLAGAFLAVAFQHATLRIWRPDVSTGPTATVSRRLVAAGAVLVAGLLVAAALLLQSVGRLVAVFDVGLRVLATSLASAAAIALLFLALTATLRASAPVAVTWRTSAMAALFTAEAVVVGTAALGIYLRNYASDSVPAALGGAILLLLWTFYVAQILLLGVVITKVFHRHAEKAAT